MKIKVKGAKKWRDIRDRRLSPEAQCEYDKRVIDAILATLAAAPSSKL